MWFLPTTLSLLPHEDPCSAGQHPNLCSCCLPSLSPSLPVLLPTVCLGRSTVQAAAMFQEQVGFAEHLFQLQGLPYKLSICCALLRLVAQSCLTLLDPMDCSPPGSSVHGDSPGKNARVGCHVLHQGIFPMQGSNPGLPHCRRILYQLSYQGSLRLSIPKSRRAKATDLAWFPVVGPGPGLTSQGANITHQPVFPS